MHTVRGPDPARRRAASVAPPAQAPPEEGPAEMADAVWLESQSDPRAQAAAASRTAVLPLPIVTGLVAFLVYLGTAAPTIGFLDSPELSAATLSLGVPHPTGYPLFVLLGHVFAKLFAIGDPAWRLNVYSAALASVAVGFITAFTARAAGRPLAGWITGLALAFSPAFWMQATLLEVYGLHLAFVSALLYLWLCYEHEYEPGVLRALALTAGLALGHHLMSLLVLPVIGVALAVHARRFARPREITLLVLLAAAPLCVLAYLPIAAALDPVVNWGDPSTLHRFVAHVTGAQYHGLVAGEGGPSPLVEIGVRLGEIARGLTPALALLVPLGVWRGAGSVGVGQDPNPRAGASTRRTSLLLIAVFVSGAGFGALYGAADREPFFLNALLVVAVWSGLGATRACDWLAARWPERRRLATLGLALTPIVPFLAHVSEQDRSADFAAHDGAMAALAVLPPDAILLVEGPYGYPPIYASLIEGVRPDVLVVDQYLRVRGEGGGYGPELDALRRRPDYDPDRFDLEVARVASQLGRPLFIAANAPDLAWEEIGYVRVREGAVDRLVPIGSGRTWVRDPRGAAQTSTAARFAGGLELVSATLGAASVEPGDVVPVNLLWQDSRAGAPADLSLTLAAGDGEGWLIANENGEPLLSFSRPLTTGSPATGDDARAWTETLHLVVPRALSGQHVVLYLGVLEGERFVPTDDSRAFVALGEVVVHSRERALWSLPAALRPPAAGPDGSSAANDQPASSRVEPATATPASSSPTASRPARAASAS